MTPVFSMPQAVKDRAARLVEERVAAPILHDARPKPEDAMALVKERVAVETSDSAALVSWRAAGQVPGKGVAVGREVVWGDGRSSQLDEEDEEADADWKGVSSSSAPIRDSVAVLVRMLAGRARGSGSACASSKSRCCEALSADSMGASSNPS